jgi:hypothetical protein
LVKERWFYEENVIYEKSTPEKSGVSAIETKTNDFPFTGQ